MFRWNTNFEESKEILQKKGLVVKEYDNLYLVKYVKGQSDMKDSDVENVEELYLKKILINYCVYLLKNQLIMIIIIIYRVMIIFNSDIVFEEFIDGTMINLFKYQDKVYISTRSCLGANCRWNSSNTFNILFNECIDFQNLKTLKRE